jgi:hypothetical protein
MPLNPQLFNALKRVFGAGVKIAKEGEPMRYSIKKNFSTEKDRVVIEEGAHGEEYRVCCPFCGDTRFRLWISHKWCTEDPKTKAKFGVGMVNCFNDGCDLNRYADQHARRTKQEDLRKLLSPLLSHTVALPRPVASEPKPVTPELPEKLVPLTQLDPAHHARHYIENVRGFNIDKLVEIYQASYCPEDPHPFISDRIIIPIRQEAKLVGYQARYIGDDISKHIPKYFTMPGMKKTRILYNYDRASQYPVGVIMEGVTDVWAVGGQGVNVFGAAASGTQCRMIHNAWGDTGIVLMSDADVMDDEEKRKQYEALRKALMPLCRWGVLEVRLPEGDPGSVWSEDLWAYILRYAERAGYKHPIFDSAAFQLACRRRPHE